jgi:hypothetical protein
MTKSLNFSREEVISQNSRQSQKDNDTDKSRVIQIVVGEKPTNLSTNSAEMNVGSHFSLERIRQESGGSQITSKKISLLKNQFKLKTANLGDKSADNSAIQVVSK